MRCSFVSFTDFPFACELQNGKFMKMGHRRIKEWVKSAHSGDDVKFGHKLLISMKEHDDRGEWDLKNVFRAFFRRRFGQNCHIFAQKTTLRMKKKHGLFFRADFLHIAVGVKNTLPSFWVLSCHSYLRNCKKWRDGFFTVTDLHNHVPLSHRYSILHLPSSIRPFSSVLRSFRPSNQPRSIPFGRIQGEENSRREDWPPLEDSTAATEGHNNITHINDKIIRILSSRTIYSRSSLSNLEQSPALWLNFADHSIIPNQLL